MTEHAPATRANTSHRLLIPVAASVVLHLAFLWNLPRPGQLRASGSDMLVESVMQVQIWQEAPKSTIKPHEPQQAPGKKPDFQKPKAASTEVARTPLNADSKAPAATTSPATNAANSPTTSPTTVPTERAQAGYGQNAETSTAPNAEQDASKPAVGPTWSRPNYRAVQPQAQPSPRSVSELAREQLVDPGEKKNALAEGIKAAGIPDCTDDSGIGLFGLPVTVYKAAAGKCK